MESTGVPGRMQISEATHLMVCADSSFLWEERGSVEIKGKGKMKTYFLVNLPSTQEEIKLRHRNDAAESGGGFADLLSHRALQA